MNSVLKQTRWFALVAVFLLSGCPEPHSVKVTIKEGTNAGGGGAGAGTTGAAPVAGYGSVHGVISFDGDAPALKKLITKGDAGVKDSAICAAEDQFEETLEVNPQNKGIKNVVIYLEKAPAHIKPELQAIPTETVIFDQKYCRFFPRVSVFRAGQKLMVLSDDSVPHNTHTFPGRNDTFSQTVAPNDRDGVECKYKKPESAPVKVVCDFHAWMKAYHFPVDHPYFAKTDADGKFRIEGLPAGKHVFNIWHESASGGLLERKVAVEVTVDGDTEKNFSFAPAKFAAVSTPSRNVAYSDLRQGGEIQVTHRETK